MTARYLFQWIATMPRSLRLALAISALGVLLLARPALAGATSTPEPAIPEVLAPWVDWVLHDADLRGCPLGSAGERICAWPGRLELVLDAEGGHFEQSWELQSTAWVPLPGGGAAWPQQVDADGQAVAVVERNGRPAVRLGPGRHQLSGAFVWPRRPDVLAIPSETGLLSLTLDGTAVSHPRIDNGGRLWLGGRGQPAVADAPDTLALEVVRRIDDEIPLRVRTRLALDVSGQARELTLGPLLLPGGIPLRVDSRLPARLTDEPGSDGASRWMLQVQLRPGRWVLAVDSHHPGPVEALRLREHDAPWPAQEVWAFAARPDLRQVEIQGAEPLDPRQTRVPADWRRLPTYAMRPGQTLILEQLRRGASAADRLRLERALRLDFGGQTFSVRDRLRGRLEQRWRLQAEPMLELGQVQVNGEPRLITRLGSADAPASAGVEVRQGRLDLVADARIDTGLGGFPVEVPASGWALPLDGVATQLHLPPGWDLLAVEGVDNLPHSWLARWSLLDIFLVLVIALAVGRLWGRPWGLLALLTLVLIWQEPGAPRWVWLHVLAAAALLRLLPAAASGQGFRVIRRLLSLYYRGALLVLAVIALPFLVAEMRDGLFPQLDRVGAGGLATHDAGVGTPASRWYETLRQTQISADETAAPAAEPKAGLAAPSPPPARLPALAPGALVQTGAGVPDWTWRSFALGSSGPVDPQQRLRLWLLPPAVVLLLAVLRVILVLLLGLRVADLLKPRRRQGGSAVAVVAGFMIVGTLMPPSVSDARAEPPAGAPAAISARTAVVPSEPRLEPAIGGPSAAFPRTELLDELKRRLLEPPDCLPRCAEIPRLGIAVFRTELRLLLEVDAAAAVALPLPGAGEGWMPTEVLLDGEPVRGLRRAADGGLLAPVPAGRHRLMLAGPLPDQTGADQVDLPLPLPLRPRQVEAGVGATWQLEGVDADGRPGDQLRLLRREPPAAAPNGPAAAADSAAALAPLLQVTRTLRFALDWTVDTTVERLSPADLPVSVRVPLLPGEAVTSPGAQVAAGGLLVSLPPGRQRTAWSASLTPVEELTLSAAEDPRLTETWRAQVSPIWHLRPSGIPPVQNLGAADRWLPTWRPWPGEQLRLRVGRPQAVAGPTLTLDRSVYRLVPAQRASDATLELRLRSSQGGRHRILLPEGAELLRLSIDGQQRPLALKDHALDLPLVPGSQEILVGWRDPAAIATVYRSPTAALGVPGVNTEIRIRPGEDRWLLWTSGPGIGPAVQFWGLLVVLAVAAAVLARSRLTPLGFFGWLLLGVGLSQAGIWAAALVTLWLFALGLRRRLGEETPRLWFNLAQLGLVALTIVALSALVVAVQQGLLGDPAMQVAGNGSSPASLNWYLDRHGPETAQVTVVSAPIWVYRALMLAWALWLAWRLLDWLRWGWQGLAAPTLWRRKEPRADKAGGAGARSDHSDEPLSVDL